jgi:hypothetical protein
MVDKSGGLRGCARNKTEMLGISGMRWYLTMALECNSMVVDTMSWRGMITQRCAIVGEVRTFYRNILHRLDGPACEYSSGTTMWRVDGKLHRVNGPAIESAIGVKQWWLNGHLHRVDGPAVEYANGEKQWWVAGVRQK